MVNFGEVTSDYVVRNRPYKTIRSYISLKLYLVSFSKESIGQRAYESYTGSV